MNIIANSENKFMKAGTPLYGGGEEQEQKRENKWKYQLLLVLLSSEEKTNDICFVLVLNGEISLVFICFIPALKKLMSFVLF